MKKYIFILFITLTLLTSDAIAFIIESHPITNLEKAQQTAICSTHGGVFNFELGALFSKNLHCRDGSSHIRKDWMNLSGPTVLKALDTIEGKKINPPTQKPNPL